MRQRDKLGRFTSKSSSIHSKSSFFSSARNYIYWRRRKIFSIFEDLEDNIAVSNRGVVVLCGLLTLFISVALFLLNYSSNKVEISVFYIFLSSIISSVILLISSQHSLHFVIGAFSDEKSILTRSSYSISMVVSAAIILNSYNENFTSTVSSIPVISSIDNETTIGILFFVIVISLMNYLSSMQRDGYKRIKYINSEEYNKKHAMIGVFSSFYFFAKYIIIYLVTVFWAISLSLDQGALLATETARGILEAEPPDALPSSVALWLLDNLVDYPPPP